MRVYPKTPSTSAIDDEPKPGDLIIPLNKEELEDTIEQTVLASHCIET